MSGFGKHYLKLTMLIPQSEYVPVGEQKELTEEEKQQKEIDRIINGEPELPQMQLLQYKQVIVSYDEYDYYCPVEKVQDVYESPSGTGTVINVGDEQEVLVKEPTAYILGYTEAVIVNHE